MTKNQVSACIWLTIFNLFAISIISIYKWRQDPDLSAEPCVLVQPEVQHMEVTRL